MSITDEPEGSATATGLPVSPSSVASDPAAASPAAIAVPVVVAGATAGRATGPSSPVASSSSVTLDALVPARGEGEA